MERMNDSIEKNIYINFKIKKITNNLYPFSFKKIKKIKEIIISLLSFVVLSLFREKKINLWQVIIWFTRCVWYYDIDNIP